MDLLLDPVELRVLGVLVEKDITTPEYYPLTLNALLNGCNQKSNRDPVEAYDEETVAGALDRLRAKGLASVLTGGSNRVPKYSHRLQEKWNLGRRETALLCELILRGPQTTGELRDRAGRMYRFSDLEEVESCLRALAESPAGALVEQLPRQPGRKEPRYRHLLGGEAHGTPAGEPVPAHRGGLESRLAALEEELQRVRLQLDRVLRELGLA